MNDYSEIERFRPKLIEILSPVVLDEFKKIKQSPDTTKIISDNGGLDAIAKYDTEVFVKSCYDALHPALKNEIYISSFSGEHSDDYINQNGLLSQWRAYGGNGGCAIVFRTHDLEEMLSSEVKSFHYDATFLGDVVYSDNEEYFRLEFSQYIDHIKNHTIEMFNRLRLGQNEPPDATKSYPSFVSCITRYKDRSFNEEKEVRIVAIPLAITIELKKRAGDIYCNSKPEKERKFRDKNGSPVPYIELFRSLKKSMGSDSIDFIDLPPFNQSRVGRATALSLPDNNSKNTVRLYISPIRALLNNLEPRLGHYFSLVGRSVGVWHGDVSNSAE